MPELPEVETIKRGLEERIIGLKIKDVKINVSKIIKEPQPQDFKEEIMGKKILSILRRGKYLILSISSDKYLVIHLKLTGQLIYGTEEQQSRVCFILSNGKYLNFNDLRLFGEIRLVKDWTQVKSINKLGPEPLDKSFNINNFSKMICKKKSKIKLLLMDQTFIAGIGNIYAQEALFRAGIHPERLSCSLNDNEIKSLFREIKEVLNEAIRYRGSSIDDYVDANGKKGDFESHLQVYGRQGDTCFKCKEKIKKIKLGGRGTCFCPQCQT